MKGSEGKDVEGWKGGGMIRGKERAEGERGKGKWKEGSNPQVPSYATVLLPNAKKNRALIGRTADQIASIASTGADGRRYFEDRKPEQRRLLGVCVRQQTCYLASVRLSIS